MTLCNLSVWNFRSAKMNIHDHSHTRIFVYYHDPHLLFAYYNYAFFVAGKITSFVLNGGSKTANDFPGEGLPGLKGLNFNERPETCHVMLQYLFIIVLMSELTDSFAGRDGD
ncbi:hypothetical protein TcasGA2_TC001078 [Tribolium castaneum]|uniref:Uncharacterized protein n=1 Tax=Tribolium castaneum TaxID=7070 RepID=D6WA01_TRICA|nr:hypothetical protein TcasGA2_TC001078 [Tribolium castaneum]